MNSIARAPKESDLIAYTTAANSNRLQTVSGPITKNYTYDAAGNPKSDGQTTFTWNAGRKLASTLRGGKIHTYKTNAFDQRISKHGPLSQRFFFFYDSTGQLIGEYRDNAGTTTPTDDWLVRQETVWLGDIPVAVIKKPTATSTIQLYYVYADHLNTPRVIVNSRNTTIWRWDNVHAFGANLPFEDPDNDGQTFEYNSRFPGQYFDKETNLHYNYFRYYEPETGRYISPDPIGLAGGMNTYGYVAGNPISFIDPLGLASLINQDGTLTVIGSNGSIIATYSSGNSTTNPKGDPYKVGSNGPAPKGIFPVQPPINTTGRPEYGSAFFPVGAVGPNGERLDIARQRGIGVHSGRRSYQSKTQGCIRVDENTIQDLLRINKNDPITQITIQ